MGKKGSWFSAIKRVFTPHSKERLGDEEPEKKRSKDRKKKGIGRLRHGESNSFIPLFREPSSIEKILGEAEREHNLVLRPLTPLEEQPRTPSFVPATDRPASPKPSSSRTANVSPQVPLPGAAALSEPPPVRATPQKPSPQASTAPPRAASPRNNVRYHQPEPTLRNQHASATKIQAAYRGYMARRGFRALKGLVRLQGVIRGQNVKRQTTNAMKHMQLLVRVQSQIQSRRIQMLENQALRQAQHRTDKEVESTLSKWTFGQSEAGNNENWDDSTLTKEEIDARMLRKVEAVMKRERAMAYAYSHQLWKGSPRSPTIFDIRSGGFPWWWNWLDRQLPLVTPSESQGMKNSQLLTPPRPGSETKPSPRPNLSSKHHNFGLEVDASTPLSTKSSFLPATKPAQTPPPPFRTPLATTSSLSKYSRRRPSRGASLMDIPLKDDDSLTSCPAFSAAPSYMAATVSAKAKARANSTPKERFPPVAPSTESNKRRLSFPLSQGIGSLFSSYKGSSSSRKGLDRHQTVESIGNRSVDSTVSMPATVGRKRFNRFV